MHALYTCMSVLASHLKANKLQELLNIFQFVSQRHLAEAFKPKQTDPTEIPEVLIDSRMEELFKAISGIKSDLTNRSRV